MANTKASTGLRRVAAVILSLAVLISMCSCSFFDDNSSGSGRTYSSDKHKPEGGATETSETTFETMEPTGTITTVPVETMDIDVSFVRDAYLISCWYDAVDDNPVDYGSVNSEDAFALKGVFYFNTPLTTVFEARLYKDDEVILTREVRMNGNVTAEADFSAGLEGLGTFETGEYYVELVFDGESIATTSIMRVL